MIKKEKCPYCGKVIKSSKSGITYHKNKCYKNPLFTKRMKEQLKNITGFTLKEFKKFCREQPTCSEAARQLKMNYKTFMKYSKFFNCYYPNPSRKGVKRDPSEFEKCRLKIDDILSNKVFCQSLKLKKKLFQAGLKEDKCEICGLCGKLDGAEYSKCELHHKDGNKYNNNLDNLQILCPNCHSLTDNFRFTNHTHKHS